MKFAVVATLVVAASLASAHRLDEYLQATTFSFDAHAVHVDLRLSPGVAVYKRVSGLIDTNGDGTISDEEGRIYAGKVLADLTLSVNGKQLPLRLISYRYPSLAEMKKGLGEIDILFDASLPDGAPRTLVFDDHHEPTIGAYLVNSEVPKDKTLQVVGQRRNFKQSHYELDFESEPSPSFAWSESATIGGFLLVGAAAFAWRRKILPNRFEAVLQNKP